MSGRISRAERDVIRRLAWNWPMPLAFAVGFLEKEWLEAKARGDSLGAWMDQVSKRLPHYR